MTNHADLIKQAELELKVREGTYKLSSKDNANTCKWVRVWINLYPKPKAFIGDLGSTPDSDIYTGTIRPPQSF